MTNIFEGDPKLILTADGADLVFRSGQPVMDQGIENLAFISLFSTPSWIGNSIERNEAGKIGSDFEETAKQPITLTALAAIEQAAVRALQSPVFGKVAATATNPEGSMIVVTITIQPPGGDIRTITATRYGQNWQLQAVNPAHERI